MAAVPPEAVLADVARLASALDAQIPAASGSNLLIGTWNLRAFGDLTPAWPPGPTDSPKRDRHAIACIAAIIGRFDVVAVQKTRRNTTALRAHLTRLGVR